MTYVGRVFQWTSGENHGLFEVVASEDSHEVKFDSGNTIAKRELAAMMVEQFVPGLDLRADAPPAFTPEQLGNPAGGAPAPAPAAPPTEESIIETILSKQKKTDTVRIPVYVELKVPTRTAFDFLCMMYDEAEISRILTRRAMSSVEEQVKALGESGGLAGKISEHYTK